MSTEQSDVERFKGADGRKKIIAHGADASLNELTEMLRRGGARSIEWAWSSPYVPDDVDNPPPGTPVLWRCTVEWHRNRRPTTIGETREPTSNYRRGVLEATADVLRQLGANVTVMDAVPDSPADLA